MLAHLTLLLVGLLGVLYILSLERFQIKPVGAHFPGTSYLTFLKPLKGDGNPAGAADDFNLEVTFQTLDTIGGVLYAEKYSGPDPSTQGGWLFEPTSGPAPPGEYHLCVEYKELVFYLIQVNAQTNARLSVDRLVLENDLTRGLTHKVTLKVNGNTMIYEERNRSYPLKSLVSTGQQYYVGGPELTLSRYVIPTFKGCIYSLKGPNGYVNFPVDHPQIHVGYC